MVMKAMAVGVDNFGVNNFDSVSDAAFDRSLFDQYMKGDIMG
jgi:hypothetical protein